MSRIGIYAGTFDPVHTGHIAFALQSLNEAKLDKIYFMPERRPRAKQHVEHFAHRVAMLKQATKPHPKFEVLELVDISFSIDRTLSKLRTLFAGDQLVFLFGSDVIQTLPAWPKAERLLKTTELVVGIRKTEDKQAVNDLISSWTIKPKNTYIIDSYAPHISSRMIREAISKRHTSAGVLRSVERYSNRHWLYVSLA